MNSNLNKINKSPNTDCQYLEYDKVHVCFGYVNRETERFGHPKRT